MGRAGNALNAKLETAFGKEVFFFQVEDVPSEVVVDHLFWARDYPVTDAAQEVEITSAIDVFQWLREVCTTKLLQNQIILWGSWDNCANQ